MNDYSTAEDEIIVTVILHGNFASLQVRLQLQLHDAIYRLRFYSDLLIHILLLSNLHNNVAPIQKNRNDK